MQRRGFLAATLAAGMAPAIVRADSLMKIVAPKPGIFVFPVGGLVMRLVDVEFNIWTATYTYRAESVGEPKDKIRLSFGGRETFAKGDLMVNWV